LKYYSNPAESPFHKLILVPYNLPLDSLFYGLSDSSFHDCPDTGRSTGGYDLFYQGGVVDCTSTVPIPVALSTAESESNMGALASRAMAHVRMLLLEFRGLDPDMTVTIPLMMDNSAAQIIGHSFRDTAHSRHIMRRWFYTRQQTERLYIVIHWIPTAVMVSDAHSKSLAGSDPSWLFHRHVVEIDVPR
jgi:hypothetical protein